LGIPPLLARDIAVSPQGKSVFVSVVGLSSGIRQVGVEVWSTQTWGELSHHTVNQNFRFGGSAAIPGTQKIVYSAQAPVSGINQGQTGIWDTSLPGLSPFSSSLSVSGITSGPVAVSPDGKAAVITGNGAGTAVAEIWDLVHHASAWKLTTGLSSVKAVACSPHSDWVVLAGAKADQTGDIEIWKLTTGVLTSHIAAPSEVVSVAFAPDQSQLAYGISENKALGGFSGTIALAAFPGGNSLGTLGTTGQEGVSVLGYSSTGMLASGGVDMTGGAQGVPVVKIWLPSSGVATASVALPPQAFSVSSTAFTPDGGTLIAFSVGSSNQSFMNSYDLATNQTDSIMMPVILQPNSISYLSGGKQMMFGSPVSLAVADNPYYTPFLFQGFTFDRPSVTGGNPVKATITLASPAPAGGVTIKLSSASSAARVPSTVHVSAGSTTAVFTVQTIKVKSTTNATLTATIATYQSTGTLTIK
jgi:WD40 repeat protein